MKTPSCLSCDTQVAFVPQQSSLMNRPMKKVQPLQKSKRPSPASGGIARGTFVRVPKERMSAVADRTWEPDRAWSILLERKYCWSCNEKISKARQATASKPRSAISASRSVRKKSRRVESPFIRRWDRLHVLLPLSRISRRYARSVCRGNILLRLLI